MMTAIIINPIINERVGTQQIPKQIQARVMFVLMKQQNKINPRHGNIRLKKPNNMFSMRFLR